LRPARVLVVLRTPADSSDDGRACDALVVHAQPPDGQARLRVPAVAHGIQAQVPGDAGHGAHPAVTHALTATGAGARHPSVMLFRAERH
jgi:hypothetical protein